MDMEKTQICDRNIADKRIAVVGIGGVGGYLAGMLGQVCPHLTLAARGARKESLEKEGLILHSEYKGELRAVPEQVVETGDLPEQDIIFICVKNYSLEGLPGAWSGGVRQNHIDPGDERSESG